MFWSRFNQGPVTGSGDGMTLTAEELEAKLVEFFHGDFMALLGACRWVQIQTLYRHNQAWQMYMQL